MREFYQQQLKLAAHLGQGCFTHDFLAVLMTNTPTTETMNLVDQLQSHEFGEQIDLLKLWAKARLNRLMSVKQLCMCLPASQHNEQKEEAKPTEEQKLRQELVQTIKVLEEKSSRIIKKLTAAMDQQVARLITSCKD